MGGFNERIKNIERVRSLIRGFCLYGFKSREQIDTMSARSYDDEKRRIESYLSDYVNYMQTPSGKNVYLSIDSRTVSHNPLYAVFKSKTFTDLDVTLHFIIFDILSDENKKMNIDEMIDIIDNEYLCCFENPLTFDESSLRKKLKEYEGLGLIISEKEGRKTFYRKAAYNNVESWMDAVAYFSETAPCGVVGFYLLDKCDSYDEPFTFKHHYSLKAMDSEILCALFEAMNHKANVELTIQNELRKKQTVKTVTPCRIIASVQNGKEYLLSYDESFCFQMIRIDRITHVKEKDVCADYDVIKEKADHFEKYIWTASTGDNKGKMERVVFEVEVKENEQYIAERLNREKRNGTVEQSGENRYLFSVDVHDCAELLPWVRTFIGRLTWVYFSNEQCSKRFNDDLYRLKKMYDCMEGE